MTSSTTPNAETPASTSRVHQRFIRFALLVGMLVAGAISVWWAVETRRDFERLNAEALTAARDQAAEAAKEIDRVFRDAQKSADVVVGDLSDGKLVFTDIEARMRAEFAAHPTLDGFAIAFEPFVYDAKERLYQEYVSRKADGTLPILKGATYDYTATPGTGPDGLKTAWYYGPKNSGPMWNEPFLATGAGKVLIEYGAPFFRRDDAARVAGVVTVDYSLHDLRQLIGGLELGTTGYGVVFTNRGTFLAHPDSSRVVAGSIFDNSPGTDNAELHAAARKAIAGESIDLDFRDPVSGQEAWVLLRPIPSTGWVMGVVRWKAESGRAPEQLLRWRVSTALAAAIAFVLFVAFLVRAEHADPHRLWIVAMVFSFCCTALVVLTWWLAWGVRPLDGVPLTSSSVANRQLEVYRNTLRKAEPVYAIPTGIQISALQFPDPHSIAISGLVWQRYSESIPEEVNRGFTFPQKIIEPPVIEEVQRTRDGTDEVIISSFIVVLQQSFDPALFPFDHRAVTINLTPVELRANVVFVPDFGSYPLIAPSSLPGMNPNIRVNNWHFRGSYFSYRPEPPGPTLGLAARAERDPAPVLHMVVDAQRNFIGPFIAYLTPAVVAAGLTFALLISGRQVSGWQDLVSGLSYIAALFFVIVVAHSSLRDMVGAVGITYLEYLYIVLYCTIALVVANLFVLAHRPDAWLVQYEGNLLPKLLYWPAYTLVILVSTLLAFVYG